MNFYFCIICNISDLNLIILGPVGQLFFGVLGILLQSLVVFIGVRRSL